MQSGAAQLTEDAAVLCVLVLGVCSQDGSEAVVVDPVVVDHHELAPALLADGALHLVFYYGLGGIEVWEVLDEVLEDLVVDLGQAEGAALDLLEDGPIRLEVLDGCERSGYGTGKNQTSRG